MAQMNPNIILAGQPANVLGAIQQGNQAAAQTNQIRQQNALSGLYKTQGAGIASGDQGALNALAGIDPFAAQAAGGAAQAQQFSAEEMQMVRDSAKREAAAHASSMEAAEASAEAAKIERAVAAGLAAQTPEEWDALAQQLGAPDLVGQFENRRAIAFRYLGIADALKESKGPAGPEWRPATPEEAAARGGTAGQISDVTGEFKRATVDKGQRIISDGRGGFTVEDVALGGDESDGIKPSSVEAMIASIDGILSDPALDKSTGMFSFLQNVPGTPQRRFGARARQLEGQAFLQAFESLKGGGQITEIEGQKATQAIARLDTAQSAADYRQALTELRDILSAAAGRPLGWVEQQNAAPAQAQPIASEDDYNALPSGTVFIAPDGTQRRKP
jgi:hypothetical protein